MQQITVFSDFICPFCYVAERGPLAELMTTIDLEIDWRGFEVHPEIPRGGISAVALMGAERLSEGKEYILQLAQRFGIEMQFPDHVPNSMRALALTEWARGHGKLVPLKDALMDKYWQEGADIEDDQVLCEAACSVGLCPERGLTACEASHWELQVIQNRALGYEMGVSGVPTFISSSDRVVGCQPTEILRRLTR